MITALASVVPTEQVTCCAHRRSSGHWRRTRRRSSAKNSMVLVASWAARARDQVASRNIASALQLVVGAPTCAAVEGARIRTCLWVRVLHLRPTPGVQACRHARFRAKVTADANAKPVTHYRRWTAHHTLLCTRARVREILYHQCRNRSASVTSTTEGQKSASLKLCSTGYLLPTSHNWYR